MFIPLNRGGLILLITFGCMLVTEESCIHLLHNDHLYNTHNQGPAFGFILAAIVIRVLSIPRKTNASNKYSQFYVSSSLADSAQSGNDFWRRLQIFRQTDNCWGIPVKFWPFILAGLAVLFYCLPQF